MLVSHVDPVHNNTSSDCTYNRPNRITMIVPYDVRQNESVQQHNKSHVHLSISIALII